MASKELNEVTKNSTNKDEKALDIYFTKKYIELSNLIEEEGAEPLFYKYEDENGEILNYLIKRPINISIEGKTYYDITTPYGYGGPIINKINNEESMSDKEKKSIKEKLVFNFEKDFKKYCDENDIVAEFVRFHPILENALDFGKIYQPILLQQTIATRCGEGDATMLEFGQSVRRNIRKLIKKGYTSEIIENPKNLDDFKRLYVDTMKRNHAKSFYFFDDKYFEYIIDNFQDNILLANVKESENNEIVASELYFIFNNKYIHMHLSATNSKFLSDSPVYLAKNESTVWADKNGYKYIHQGGGTSSDPEDTLYLFKKKFTKSPLFDFYIGKKVYNKKIYDKLVEITQTQNSTFFPQYRDIKVNQ